MAMNLFKRIELATMKAKDRAQRRAGKDVDAYMEAKKLADKLDKKQRAMEHNAFVSEYNYNMKPEIYEMYENAVDNGGLANMTPKQVWELGEPYAGGLTSRRRRLYEDMLKMQQAIQDGSLKLDH